MIINGYKCHINAYCNNINVSQYPMNTNTESHRWLPRPGQWQSAQGRNLHFAIALVAPRGSSLSFSLLY